MSQGAPAGYVPQLFDVWVYEILPGAPAGWRYLGRMTLQQLELGHSAPPAAGGAFFFRPAGFAALV